MCEQLSKLLIDPNFRKYVEAWVIIISPWVLLLDQYAVHSPDFDLFPEDSFEEGLNAASLH